MTCRGTFPGSESWTPLVKVIKINKFSNIPGPYALADLDWKYSIFVTWKFLNIRAICAVHIRRELCIVKMRKRQSNIQRSCVYL